MARTGDLPEAQRLAAPHVRVALVCSGFHKDLTEALVAGARERLIECGLPEKNISEYWVPGAYEAPLAAKYVTQSGRYAAVVALGAVVRGATAHFEHVCYGASQGLMRVATNTGVPCTFGILTTDTVEQAWARAGGEVGNAGVDAVDAAVALLNLHGQLGL